MPSDLNAIHRMLSEHLDDATSSFSVGSYGAVAEFHRREDEPVQRLDTETLDIVTRRGALSLNITPSLRPVAYENLGRNTSWQQGVIFCLPEREAHGARRKQLTDLGADVGAMRSADRTATLFDLGLGLKNADFCVRTDDAELIEFLGAHAGEQLLDGGHDVIAKLVEHDPHRVVLTGSARAEIYQPIAREKTPEGPHTHLLPRLIATGRTHSANVPVPAGMRPCFTLHPRHPLFDALGEPTQFQERCFERFQCLLEQWGIEAYRREKARAQAAIGNASAPCAYATPDSRLGRAALRVAIRQLQAKRPGNAALEAWRRTFDRH